MANPKDKTANKTQTGNQGDITNAGTTGATAGGQGSTGLTGESAGTGNIKTMNSTTGTNTSTGATGASGTTGGSGSTSGGGGGTLAGAATATARSFVDQAKETAGQAYEAVTEKAATTLDEKKTTLSGGLSTVADSIRQVGHNLSGAQGEGALPEAAAKYSNTAAQQIESVANYFERKNVRDMVRDVEGFARRNPGMFIGAAFGLGLIAARFLKSSPPHAYEGSSTGSGFDQDRSRWHSGQGVSIDEAGLKGAGTANQERRTGSQGTGLTGSRSTGGASAGLTGPAGSTGGHTGTTGTPGSDPVGFEGTTGANKKTGGASTKSTSSTRDSI